MTLPGFYANHSLYQSGKQYTRALAREGVAHDLAVPQAGGGCYYAFGSWHTCAAGATCCRYPEGCQCVYGRTCPASHPGGGGDCP